MKTIYCSSCGSAILSNLSYCNRCGTELKVKESESTKSSEVSLDSLVWAIVVVTVAGLGAVIGLMAVMKEVLHFSDGLILIFSLLSFLAFLGAESVFIWLLLLRSKLGAQEASSRLQPKELTTREIDDTQVRALPEPSLSASVTEHTTRTLDPVNRQTKT